MLEVRDLRASYGKVEVLQGVSLDVGDGEIVGLLGRNGVGKTTTLKSIMGLVPASSGHAAFNGVDLTGLAAHKAANPDFNITNVHFFPLGGIKTNANWAMENGGAAAAPARQPIEG